MATKEKTKEKGKPQIILPPTGWVKELAEACNCSEVTVRNAIKYDRPTEKCEAIRDKYREMYMSESEK